MIKINEPAFPGPGVLGMSMRQWYKGQALIGLLSYRYANERFNGKGNLIYAADEADEMADRMIKGDARHEQRVADGNK